MIQQFIVARDSVVLWRVREDNPRFLWFWEITGFEYPATLILRGEYRSALLDEIKKRREARQGGAPGTRKNRGN